MKILKPLSNLFFIALFCAVVGTVLGSLAGCAGSQALTYDQQMHRYEQAMDRTFGRPTQRIKLEVR